MKRRRFLNSIKNGLWVGLIGYPLKDVFQRCFAVTRSTAKRVVSYPGGLKRFEREAVKKRGKWAG